MKTVRNGKGKWLILLLALLMLPSLGRAEGYDGEAVSGWLTQFADALSALSPLNDPQETADPARAGQYLIEYEFGTVLSKCADASQAQDMLEIDVRTAQVTDCRGVRVGMGLNEVLGGAQMTEGSSQLIVLSTQEAGIGWSWAYVSDGGVYGVEYITYGGEGADMKEYTLTYVIEDQIITAIRLRIADATQAQAEAGLSTAEEIASRQVGEVLAAQNEASIFSEADLQVMGADALGVPVYDLVARMGEPQEVQTLPGGSGRILLYSGAVVTLALEEYTGVEVVRGITVSSEEIAGPRGLRTGMSIQQAAALFACEQNIYSSGGLLYMQGEALGEPPYGELSRGEGGEATLRYACLTDKGETAMLEVGIEQEDVAYYTLSFGGVEAEGGI